MRMPSGIQPGGSICTKGASEETALRVGAGAVTISDPVNHPPHYVGKVECIDAIESALGREQFIGFLRGQVMKYAFRCGKKDNAAQDAAKAKWYAERLEKLLAG